MSALYRITARRPTESRGTSLVRLSPLQRAKSGMSAGVALRFTFAESETVLRALEARHPGIIFRRVTV